MMNPVIIYTENFSSRLSYSVEILLGSLLGLPYQITTDIKYFNNSVYPKINYSRISFENSIQIIPCGLLMEKGVRNIDPEFSLWNNMPVLFFREPNNLIPFDIFSASFYLLSRYEEYLPFRPDDHGRFNSDLSVAGKNGFLEEPVVQQWAQFLLKIMKSQFPNIVARRQKFNMETTIDVDIAYAYLHRNLLRLVLGSGRDITSFKWNQVVDRLLVSLKYKTDPFNTYSYIELLHRKYDLPVYMFFLAGDYSNYDRNIPFYDPSIQKLVKELSDKFFLGAHPSYRAFENFDTLQSEVQRMAKCIGKPIIRSRQHFLRLSFPKTYQWLIKLGITHDYSMGYHDKPGFRAGISIPFKYYDIQTETITNLTVHPFVFMERTLRDRLKMNPDMALLKIQDLMKKVNAVNGVFGTLWHNDSLSNYGEWKRWRYVYEVMLSMGYTMSRKHERSKRVMQYDLD